MNLTTEISNNSNAVYWSQLTQAVGAGLAQVGIVTAIALAILTFPPATIGATVIAVMGCSSIALFGLGSVILLIGMCIPTKLQPEEGDQSVEEAERQLEELHRETDAQAQAIQRDYQAECEQRERDRKGIAELRAQLPTEEEIKQQGREARARLIQATLEDLQDFRADLREREQILMGQKH